MAEIEGLERRRPEQARRDHTLPSHRVELAENPHVPGAPGGVDEWTSPKWQEHRVNRIKGKFSHQRQLPPARDRKAHHWRGTGIEPALDTSDWTSPLWSDNKLLPRNAATTRQHVAARLAGGREQVVPDQMATAPSSGPPPAIRKRALDVARRIVTADAEFEESDVKRDDEGKFAAQAGGGGAAKPEEPPAKSRAVGRRMSKAGRPYALVEHPDGQYSVLARQEHYTSRSGRVIGPGGVGYSWPYVGDKYKMSKAEAETIFNRRTKGGKEWRAKGERKEGEDMAGDWASPAWDEAFSEADIKRNDKGQFQAGSGAAKPPFDKGNGRIAKPNGSKRKFKLPPKVKSRAKLSASVGGTPHTIHSHGRAVHWDQAQDGPQMAQDGARLRTLALATARQLARQAASQGPPRMAFDRNTLPSQRFRLRLAFDQHSVRTFSPDGHMHVALSNISRAQVSPYWGKEIPDADQLGLDPAKKYMLLRHPDELAKAAQTFNGLPILAEHQPISSDDHPHDLVIGATGTDARWEAPFLVNSLHFWAKPAIDAIRTGKQRELSCAYHYRPLMQPGVYEGVRYDGIMTDIHGNHVALVEDGRVGPAAVVADAMPFDLRFAMWLRGS